jgi:hypothetical protein
VSSSVYLAFGGVALLGIIGFVFAWITAPAKTSKPAQRTTSSGTASASRLTSA